MSLQEKREGRLRMRTRDEEAEGGEVRPGGVKSREIRRRSSAYAARRDAENAERSVNGSNLLATASGGSHERGGFVKS